MKPDTALAIAIQDWQSLGLAYTPRQLYYELCRTLSKHWGLASRDIGYTLGIGALPALALLVTKHGTLRQRLLRAGAWLALDALAVGSLRLLRYLPYTRTVPIAYPMFDQLVARYQEQHGAIVGLLTSAPPQTKWIVASEPDLTDYGLSGLVLCQSLNVAQMLRANQLYIELGYAIMALQEATPLPDAIYIMLARQPNAPIYLLHDASSVGLSLIKDIHAQLEIAPERRVIAVGLRPRDAWRLHLFARTVETDPANQSRYVHSPWPDYLTQREENWLHNQWCVEVEAMEPAHLLRALRYTALKPSPTHEKISNFQQIRTLGFMNQI